ncbi:hypothetical protein KIW84_074349 [Lathyrus oleraceus]|uniref:Alpha-N-acetylglucosaminidase tim-barrel domain-containing protein n=1 Tax=Pisum sativum TaxID=3888 RepID=A0A9D4VTV1_PEA|nr:hypothetical protein KIW84_074349 [Pisum sativum]
MSISDLDDFFRGPAFLAWSQENSCQLFSGNVPAALKYIFPSAKITRLGNWFSVKSAPKWTCTYLLDATDPLFVEIGKAFVEQQLQEYGRSSHIYNCDENTHPIDVPWYQDDWLKASANRLQHWKSLLLNLMLCRNLSRCMSIH